MDRRVISRREYKALREYKCEGCGQPIHKHTKYVRVNVEIDQVITQEVRHLQCEAT